MAKFAHYKLDADVLDSEGNNDGTANSITFNDGAAVFVAAAGADPEVASHVELDHSAFHLQTFSFSFWVNPTTVSNGAGRSGRWLASCMGPNLGWSLKMNHNRHLTFQQFSGTGHLRQCITNAASEKVKIGEWKHYVMTVSPSGLHLYSNGTLASQATTPIAWDMDFTGAKAYLGRVQDNTNAGGAGDSLDGSLDDVQFFDHVLTAAEVTTLYNAGRPDETTEPAELLAHYRLDNDTDDSEGSNNPFQVNQVGFSGDGAATFAVQPLGTARDASPYISLQGNETTFEKQTFSMAFWIKASDFINYQTEEGRWVASNHVSNEAFLKGWRLTLSEDGSVVYYEFSGDGSYRSVISDEGAGSPKLSLDTWHHVAVTTEFSSANNAYTGKSRIYIDGQLANEGATARDFQIGYTNCVMYIGRSNDTASGENFAGELDDFRWYGDALGADEVAALYNAGRPDSLTQSEDSLATDLALELKFTALPQGATNDGNSTFEKDGDRTYVSFPTTTDMLTIQDASEYEYTTENFTVAFWMRPTSAVQGSWAHPFIMDSLGNFGGYYMFQEASVHNTYGFVGNANFQWHDPDPRVVISVDTWTHVTIVREGTQSKIYINGQLDSTNPNDVAATIGWGGSQLMIGHQFIGDISDFRIWSRALSAGEAGQVYAYPLDGSIIADSGKTFVYVEALPVVTEGVSYASYQMTDTKKYIVRLENGAVYEGTTVGSPGDNGSWTKTTISDHGTGPLAPGGLCRAGNFWVTHKPSNRGLSAGEGLQTAWAAGLDAQGNAITPESWNLLALGGAEDVAYVYGNPSEDRAFALTHPSQNSAAGWRSVLWAANQASSSADSLTWTKLNMSASSDHKAITAGILDYNGGAYNYSDGGLRIMFAAANASNQHVFVAEAVNNLTSERGEHLLVYSGSAGWDNVVLTYADFPANARRMSKPVYFNSKWYVGESLGVLVSSDGISWSRKTLDFDGADVQIEHVAGDPVSGSIIAVGTSTNANGSVGVVAHSSDDGVSWEVDAYVEGLSFTAVANVEEGVFVLGCADGWVAFSNNDGHDWTLSQSIRAADVADVVSVQAVD